MRGEEESVEGGGVGGGRRDGGWESGGMMAIDVPIDALSLKHSSHHSSGREGCILSLSSLRNGFTKCSVLTSIECVCTLRRMGLQLAGLVPAAMLCSHPALPPYPSHDSHSLNSTEMKGAPTSCVKPSVSHREIWHMVCSVSL